MNFDFSALNFFNFLKRIFENLIIQRSLVIINSKKRKKYKQKLYANMQFLLH